MSSNTLKRVLAVTAVALVPVMGLATNASATTVAGSKAVSYIEKHDMGKPYSESSGRLGPNHFDCSGLIYSAFKAVGHDMGKTHTTTNTEWSYLSKKHQTSSKHQTKAHHTVQVGDILFFWNHGSVQHVGIYIGHNEMIDANSTHGKVKIDDAFYNWGFSYITFGWVK